jgi:hypothetical protein
MSTGIRMVVMLVGLDCIALVLFELHSTSGIENS